MPQEDKKGGLMAQVETEIRDYLTGVVNISEAHEFSQAKLIRRIILFENHIYPRGKFDSEGNYKFWYDGITNRINGEVKNIDFDTKDVKVFSESKRYQLADILSNLKLKEYLREKGQAEEINSAIEEGAGWGNILWKKIIKKGYERVDLRNIYIINQAAENVDDTPIIERHQFSQSSLRAMKDIWDNVDNVIKGVSSKTYSKTEESQDTTTTVPYYDIYERNGEVKLSDLKEYRGEELKPGDDEKYVHAKVIVAGKKSTRSYPDIKFTLFAQETNKKNSDIYKEYHRGRYKGRWWREGLFELLMDIQVRMNQIGNQIARGLEYASKIIFTSEDKTIIDNILTDLRNGDLLNTREIKVVQVRMQGFDQLVADWNQIQRLADDIANSLEVVQGITPPSGTPLGTTRLLNINANKLFDFLREKLAIPYSEIFRTWILPKLVDELKAKEILRLTGDSNMLDRLYTFLVNDWYVRNLIRIGPHAPELGDLMKQQKLEELRTRPQLLMKSVKKFFDGYKPHAQIIITGENVNLVERIQTYSELAGIELDPVRRTAIIEFIMKLKGEDIDAFPKSTPEQLVRNQEPRESTETQKLE